MEKSLLFLEKVFLKPCKNEPLRGVEIFNARLVQDLIAQGCSVTLLVTAGWKKKLEEQLPDGSHPEWIIVPETPIDVLNAMLGARALRQRHFTWVLVANVGKSLAPFLQWLEKRQAFDRVVLIAHREATGPFAKLFSRLPGHVVAVNEVIARPFREAGHPAVHVDYGVMDGNRYGPGKEPSRPDGMVRFCVFGALDNAWKGSDTAVEAFGLLPGPVRERCELHLAAFSEPPSYTDPNIKVHTWLDYAEVPGFLRSMDVMVVPSRDEEVMRETFSQAMVQGMLSGLPQLVHDLPILTEKLDEGGGTCFKTPLELAEGMEKLANDEALRETMGAQARKTALERYVWDSKRFAERYLDGPA